MGRTTGRVGVALVLAALLFTAGGTAGVVDAHAVGIAARSAAADGSAPTTHGQRFTIELYRRGAFVSQTNLVQCVGASMQMMLNLIGPGIDRTATTQRRLFDLARSLRDPTVAGNRTWRGASARGWALGLTAVGAGPYRVVSAATIDDALKIFSKYHEVNPLPVTDNQDKLAGIISRYDIVKLFGSPRAIVEQKMNERDLDRNINNFLSTFERRFLFVSKLRTNYWLILSILFAVIGFIVAFALIIRINMH